jgi:formylglycine-generating enzyme required for sulfatase activity/tRNA A-37 threonylcarbamoyl transferase component Bud32
MFHANDKIGDYTLIKYLGEGQFGEVWLAEKRTRVVANKVALKLPKSRVKFEDVEKEARVWEQAKGHPNILPIVDADIHENQVFIVSEYSPDGSLEDWLKQHGGKAPSIHAAIEMMRGILAGLEHLHKRQIIHRDLKPANILLQGEIPRITDFGIAKFLPSGTDSNLIKGSPAYMSPEALNGDRNEQTDLWSASVVFYELLCGDRPFGGRGQHKGMYSIYDFELQPLPEIMPKALREFVATALKKQTNERYLTAIAMRSELQKIYRDILRIGEESTIIIPPVPEPSSLLHSQPLPPIPLALTPSPQSASVSPKLNPQPQLVTNSDSPVVAKAQLAVTKRVSRVVVGIVVILFVLSTGTWGIFRFILNKPDTPLENNGESQLKETETNVGTFVQLPTGEFMMGGEQNSDEKPVHKVRITKAFEMGKYEVTQSQWQAVMGNNPSSFKGANLPVEQVSWNDVQEFIKKLNAKNDDYIYRLPTEAEWEYACRAGTIGDYAGNLDEMGWYNKNSENKTHSIGEKKSNNWKLHDMYGNVWEWCSDWYDSKYYAKSPEVDPKGPDSGLTRVLRGGGLLNPAATCRSASRYNDTSSTRFYRIGFRLVRTPR